MLQTVDGVDDSKKAGGKMKQKIITVLGGNGFLGHYLVQRLARAGYRLRIISRNQNAALKLKTAGDVGQVAILAGNINDPASYKSMLKDSYAVVNLVGILFETRNQKFNAVHSIGAEKLALASKSAGVKRFIQISALGVENENTSGYARSKALGELAVLSAFPEATILRPSVIFGAEDNFFNKFAKMANISPVLPLIGGGKTLFQPVYVDDVAHAIEKCLSEEEAKGQTYELGGVHTYSFKQILEYILSSTGKKRLLLSIPFGLASLMAGILEYFPTPALTRDQVKLLKHNNTVSPTAKSLAHLGITPTAVEMVAPDYLSMYTKTTQKITAELC